MKYLSSSTTSLSILVAVVLFVVASLFEQDGPAPEPVTGGDNQHPLGSVRADSEVRDERHTADCRQAESALLARVEASQTCSEDDDCTILDYGYPMQCLTSIAASEVSAVRLEYRNYEEACSYRVYYDCPSEPMLRVPVCRNQRCEVELQRNDRLLELTLEYINGQSEGTP